MPAYNLSWPPLSSPFMFILGLFGNTFCGHISKIVHFKTAISHIEDFDSLCVQAFVQIVYLTVACGF